MVCSRFRKMAMNDLNFYKDRLDKFYNNQDVKKIIDAVKVESKNVRKLAFENPNWKTVNHTDESDLSTRGYYAHLPIEEFKHLYDKAILDIEEYIPKNNKYKMKEESDTNIRYVSRFKKEKLFTNGVDEYAIDNVKFAHKTFSECSINKKGYNLRVSIVKDQYDRMMKDARKFENDLTQIKNLSTDAAQCVSKIMSLISRTTKEGFKCVTEYVNADNYMYNYNTRMIRRVNSILKRAD